MPDGIDLRTTARHAIRLWRAAGRGRQVPPAGDTAHADAVKALLGSMWTLAGNDHPVAEAEMLATAEGRLPLRLVLTGRDSFALYATSIGDEIEDRLFPHLWTTRIACKRRASGLKVTSRRVTTLPQAVADEETLHEWVEAAQWVGRSVPAILQEHGSYEEPHPHYGYETIRKAFAAVGRGRVGRLLDDEADVEAAVAALIAESHAATGRRTHVVNVLAIEPFAVVRRTAFHSERAEGFSSRWNHVPVTSAYLVLSLQDDAFRALYRRAVGDRARALVAEAYASQYKDKAYQRRQFVETVGRPPEIVTSNLTEWSKPGADSVSKPRSWRGMALEANWSETLRQLDVRRMPDGSGDLWAPRLDEMLVWMDPAAPAVLNALCERHGWGPAPYVPWPRG